MKKHVRTKEHCEKISKAIKGKKRSDEIKKKMCEAHKKKYGNGFFGKKHTKKQKKK